MVASAVAIAAAWSGMLACNAIVGVVDVRLDRRPDGAAGDEEDSGSVSEDGGPAARPNVLQTALGDGHSCARKPAGTVECWGEDVQGQTGAGEAAAGGISLVPRPVKDLDDAIDLASGRNHSCVVRRDGSVACWGYNFDGQLGNGEGGNRSNVPVAVVSVSRAVMVAAGGNFSCALRSSGSVACWGGNASGQLGNGRQTASPTPVAVTGLTGAVAIAAGQAHACAVKSDGEVVCWGDGKNGQLGNAAAQTSLTPVVADGVPAASLVALGDRSSCALTRTGSVFCWGANELGQIGSGATNANANPSPITVVNIDDATSIAAGRNHTCASRKSGGVVCWGAGASGQLGDGQVRVDGGGAQPSVVAVTGLSNATGIGGGGGHGCAPTADDAVQCWGANDRGQLGNGTQVPSNAPVSVTGYP